MVHNSSSFQCFLYDNHKDHNRNTYISLKFSSEVETDAKKSELVQNLANNKKNHSFRSNAKVIFK